MSSHPPAPAGPRLAAGLEALAARLERASGDEVLVAEDLQLHHEALADLTQDPRATTAVLVARHGDPGDVRAGACADVRLRDGRVVAASSTFHRAGRADARFAGAMRVAEGDRGAAAGAARRAAGLARDSGWEGDPLDYLLVALVRAGTPVRAVQLDPWPWRRGPGGADAATFGEALDGIGPDRVHLLRLARATKTDDGAWATLVSRPLSRRLTPLALRLGLSPDQVTLASFALGLGAAACFATGARTGLVTGAVLLQLSLVVDCVDGDVARYRRAFTAAGAWLDASTDRLKEFACYAGLAVGAGGGRDTWLLAGAMLTVQTVRHTVDYTFTAVHELREAGSSPAVPLEVADAGPAPGTAPAARAVRASERSNRRAGVKWAKRVLHLGIGERWAVLSVLAALGRPATALAVLLVLALASFGYTAAGRGLRTRSWARQEPSGREREVVAAQVDAGPLLPGLDAWVAGGRSRWLWARPALVRLGEYAGVLFPTYALGGAGPAAFALLLAVASHHYDALYRVLNGLRPPARGARWAGLGVAGRLVVVTALALAGGGVLEGGLWVLAGALGILFLVVEPAGVLRAARRSVRRTPPGGADAGGGHA